MSKPRGKGSQKRRQSGQRPAPPRQPANADRRKDAGKPLAGKPRGLRECPRAPAAGDSNRSMLKWRVLAIAGAVVWLASVVNAAVPMFRCSAAWADKALFLTIMLLPWLWVRAAWALRDWRWRFGATGVAVACGVLGPWLAWQAGAWAVDRKVVDRVVLPPGGEVLAYEERDPGSKHVRMLVRHERRAFAGVIVVRELARHDDAHGGRLEMLDAETVRIRPGRLLGEVPVIDRKLKPWVWW